WSFAISGRSFLIWLAMAGFEGGVASDNSCERAAFSARSAARSRVIDWQERRARPSRASKPGRRRRRRALDSRNRIGRSGIVRMIVPPGCAAARIEFELIQVGGPELERPDAHRGRLGKWHVFVPRTCLPQVRAFVPHGGMRGPWPYPSALFGK